MVDFMPSPSTGNAGPGTPNCERTMAWSTGVSINGGSDYDDDDDTSGGTRSTGGRGSVACQYSSEGNFRKIVMTNTCAARASSEGRNRNDD